MRRIKEMLAKYKAWRKRTKPTRRKVIRYSLAAFLTWYLFCLPAELFTDSTSTVLLDRNGKLLGAKIADDGQWRFPHSEHVPEKTAVCLIAFEDKNFYDHFGVSISGIGRAMMQNSRSGKVVSGGSTITMQLARLMLKNPPRTYLGKVYEMILATRIEMHYSKDEILAMYCSNAPFGNNVVGLETAAWRYYGRSADQLSWAESATLAVLPNAPGLIYPGKNHQRLLEKRNRLLRKLYNTGKIDAATYELSVTEPLPDKPLPLPQTASHLLSHFIKNGQKGKLINSTIDLNMQQQAALQLEIHHTILRDNKIMNGAVIITSVNTGEILTYIGNTGSRDEENSGYVDCASAERSSGSILKPLLYAKCLESGQITPAMLLNDIPAQYGGYSPKNYSGAFDGAVPASKALSRSLNSPMVQLLNEYGTAKFRKDLQGLGLTTIKRPASHYGLTLILGGAETKLNELNKVYTQLAQELKFGERKPVTLSTGGEKKTVSGKTIERGAIYSTFEAMIEVNRPDEENQWRMFSSSQPIAWKTGTSFGFRDGWAIGITPDYVVSVWIGNADGEGRPGLTGTKAAAPLLFDLFRMLPDSKKWFAKPSTIKPVALCTESGFLAGSYCEHKMYSMIPVSCKSAPACPYHQLIHLDATETFRVDAECESPFNIHNKKWFVLPPAIERFYKTSHPNYKTLPPFKPECLSVVSDRSMQIIYPRNGASVYVPKEISGKRGKMIMEATHRQRGVKVFWHLDGSFIGQTTEIHQLSINPGEGKHKLTVIDENGLTQTVSFSAS